MIEVYYAEDDETIGKSVKEYLEQQNCKVAVFDRIADVKKALIGHLPTIVLLDWNMPDGQGSELCLWIRERWKTLPIVYLTIRGDSHDIVTGFQNGADDYVVKPFSPKEVLARINAIIKRNKSGNEPVGETVKFEGLEINFTARDVFIDGEKANLTPKEYDLLFYLVKNKNIALTRNKLLEEVWGYDFFGDSRTVDVHIKRLREKIEDPAHSWQIKTVWGIGYKFNDAP